MPDIRNNGAHSTTCVNRWTVTNHICTCGKPFKVTDTKLEYGLKVGKLMKALEVGGYLPRTP